MTKEVLEKYKSIAEYIYRKNPNISDKELSNVLLADLFKAGFDPNQPRNPDGTWGSGAPKRIEDKPCFKEWFGDSKTVDGDGKPIILSHGGLGEIEEFSDDYAGQTTADNPHGAFYFSNKKEVAISYSIQAFNRMYQDNPEGLIYDGIVDELPEFDGYGDQYEFVENLAYENINVVNAFIRMENPFIINADYQNLRELEKIFNIQGAIGVMKGDFTEFPDQFYDFLDENNDWADGPFDGIIIKNVIDDIGPRSNMYQDVYIATDPNQIKSNTAKSFCSESNINKSQKAGFRDDQRRDTQGRWTDKWAGMKKFEQEIKDNDFESAGVYDKDGKEIFIKKGGSFTVQFQQSQIYKMRDAILTHNHPGLSSFSHADIRFLFSTGLTDIRAINSAGDIFTMNKAADYGDIFAKFGKNPIQMINRTFDEAREKINKLTNQKIATLAMQEVTGEISSIDMDNAISKLTGEETHLIWAEVANSEFGQFALKYTKE